MNNLYWMLYCTISLKLCFCPDSGLVFLKMWLFFFTERFFLIYRMYITECISSVTNSKLRIKCGHLLSPKIWQSWGKVCFMYDRMSAYFWQIMVVLMVSPWVCSVINSTLLHWKLRSLKVWSTKWVQRYHLHHTAKKANDSISRNLWCHVQLSLKAVAYQRSRAIRWYLKSSTQSYLTYAQVFFGNAECFKASLDCLFINNKKKNEKRFSKSSSMRYYEPFDLMIQIFHTINEIFIAFKKWRLRPI